MKTKKQMKWQREGEAAAVISHADVKKKHQNNI